jgi:metal-sulfur cluster biosynthetic enzyme
MTEAQLLTALRDCFDPEIPLNIVDLGLVSSAALGPDPGAPGANIPGVPPRFAATVTLLPRDEAADPQLRALVHNRLAGIYELSRITVLTADTPIWTPALITPAGRRTLGLDQPHFPILNNRIR